MGARMRAVVISCILHTCCQAQTNPTLENCLSWVGLPAADGPGDWSVSVTLTVSQQKDASKIILDPRANYSHLVYVVFSTLPRMRFNEGCVGQQLRFRIVWKPRPAYGYGLLVQRGDLVLSGYFGTSPSRHGGILDLSKEDLNALREITSIREFLLTRRLKLDEWQQ